MTMLQSEITDVTDTAIWIAAYRAEEAKRKDALFKDEYAEILIGENGINLATRTQGSRYTAWSVVMRTFIIDKFITELLKENIDTVLNLGAGLDTRPYRMELPTKLRWIEVDFPKIIELKDEKLIDCKPKCHLERFKIDLSDEELRNSFLKKISNESKKVLILTEGVIPYLTNSQATSLAKELYFHENFSHWITEYYSPEILKFLRTPKRMTQMKNAPFQFYPTDWFEFFQELGWMEKTTKYFGEESTRVGRTPPTPGWLKNNNQVLDHNAVKKYLGYSIYSRNSVLNVP